MNELRDPISEWSHAIAERIGTLIICTFIFAFICGMFAPVFAPFIKRYLKRLYVMDPNYEEIANRKMKTVKILLWGLAIAEWTLVALIEIFHTY